MTIRIVETAPGSASGNIVMSINGGSVAPVFGSNVTATFSGGVTIDGVTYSYNGGSPLSLSLGTNVIPGIATIPTATPEPATWLALASGALALVAIRRRK